MPASVLPMRFWLNKCILTRQFNNQVGIQRAFQHMWQKMLLLDMAYPSFNRVHVWITVKVSNAYHTLTWSALVASVTLSHSPSPPTSPQKNPPVVQASLICVRVCVRVRVCNFVFVCLCVRACECVCASLQVSSCVSVFVWVNLKGYCLHYTS